VRKTPYKKWLVAGFLLLMPWVAQAAGLGKLTILSALGQPLLAEVDLISVRTGELATLTARIAPPEAFTQAKIPYNPALVGVRMSTERRANGQPYIKIISTRAVNEPFINLLVELSWPQGRLVREYTALIDPIGYTPAVRVAPVTPIAPPVAVTRPVTRETQPIAPAPQPPVTAAAGKEYGPVKRGETLFRIASKVKPEGVTVEQMLVALYHANPDAFAGNMNLLKAGKILRVPEKQRVIATSHSEALKEMRVETADWNDYRQKLAAAAGKAPARGPKSAASGKITAKVGGPATGKAAPKEVLKLSKAEPAAGKAGGGKRAQLSVPDRIRMLEEEAIAREQALAEANNRIAQLEKTNQDMQRVLEIRARAPAVNRAPKPPPSAPEPDLMEQMEQIMSEPTYQAAGGGVLALLLLYLLVLRRRARTGDGGAVRERSAPKLAETPRAAAAVSAERAAVPVTRMSVASGVDDVDPLAEADMYLNFGRDAQAEEVLKDVLAKTPGHEEAQLKLLQVYAGRKDKAAFEKIARTLRAQTKGAGDNWIKAAAMGYAFNPENALYEAGKSEPAARPVVGGVDPDFAFNADHEAASTASVAEADSINAPAAEADQSVRMQLGEIAGAAVTQPPAEPAATLDVPGDETVVTNVTGDSAAPMSNMIDFSFDATPARPPAESADDSKGVAHDGAPDVSPEQQRAPTEPEPGVDLEFNVGDKPETASVAGANSAAAEKSAEAAGADMPMIEPDFRLDFGGGETTSPAPEIKLDNIDLNFEEKPTAEVPKTESGARDDHWHDVQTKFDLAKAYQEMGEKGGAREILQEVIKEGDPGQRAEAQKLLESLN